MEMLESLHIVRNEYNSPETLADQDLPSLDPDTVAQEILSCHDNSKSGSISLEDYLMWTVNNNLTDDFLSLLSQVCHIVLGLKPQNREEEGKIIQNWLERESRHPLKVSQVWYLISMQWYTAWLEYVNVQLDGSTSTPKHRIAKGKNSGGSSLAWEDDNVIMIGMKSSDKSGNNNSNSSIGGAVSNSTRPVRKHGLNPPDTGSQPHSPSTSPKMKRKTLTSSCPQRPPAIDNSPLLASSPNKFSSLTNEGGRLRRDIMLVRGKDFEIVPEPIWRALASWYGGSPALPRTVIQRTKEDDAPSLELYPISVRLLRHQMPSQRPQPATSITGMMAGIGGMAWSLANSPATPRRYLAYTAAFSRKHTLQQVYDFLCSKLRFCREDIRLWKISSKDEQSMTLLDDENLTVEEAAIEDNQQVLIEVRNKDLTWPEEMSQLAKNKMLKKDDIPTTKGATGLNNLGNTCFMNAALQCVSNTWPLTQYFAGNLHLFELNRDNPLGMKGHIAQRYGELIKDLWSGTSRTVAPLKLRWTIGKYAPRFNGFQQHDSQELLSFLLDGLHEDLNRVHKKPYVELKDSDDRPDEVVAREAWENHLLRNQSLIVDLFHGQLKSQVRCKECGKVSVRFDPYSYLSLPLPMDSCIHLEILVNRLDGSVPVKYGLRLNMDEKYKALKRELCSLSGIPVEQLLLVEVLGPIVKTLPKDEQKIRTLLGGTLYAYELPVPPEIPQMSAEDEHHCQAVTKESIGLNEIQRGKITKTMSGSITSLSPCKMANGQLPHHYQHGQQQALEYTLSQAPELGGQDSPLNAGTPSMISSTSDSLTRSLELFDNFLIGVHRKMVLMDVYFLSSQKTRPSLFGTPIIIPRDENTTCQDLYHFVWVQVARLVSPLPPSEQRTTNHAQDCDDSLGYEYPFTLKLVQKDGFTCAKCPWYRFCRGCRIDCNAEIFEAGQSGSFLAIDWEPTALHLRYQTSQERYYEEHESVEESRRLQTDPIDLDTCLQAFTKEEELGEDELYYCSHCKKHCLASKKLDIWRLPPVLVINLKRFQYLNGRWVKSHKIVRFPRKDFDPTKYLAPRKPKGFEEIMEKSFCLSVTTQDTTTTNTPVISTAEVTEGRAGGDDGSQRDHSLLNGQSQTGSGMCELEKKLKLYDGEDFTDARYDLYAMSCHTGILGGGHYVAYAKNPNNKWYCYNDSSCKEVQEDQLDTNSAYILFYERQGVNFSTFMPDTTGKEPDLSEIDDEFESDFKKMCILQ